VDVMNEWPGGFLIFVIRGLGLLSRFAGQFFLNYFKERYSIVNVHLA
jgi:hypothetical protein